MDWELFGFLIFVVIYLVATISEKTKKRKKKAEEKAKQTVLPTQAFESGEKEEDDLSEEQPAEERVFNDPCKQEEQPPIHLHQVTEQQFEAAQEGDDPCHAGGVTAVRLEHHDGEDTPEAADLEAMRLDSDILRGVIMSEVLMRPAERAALRRIKRGKRT